jgi:hypothetical protein
MPRSPEPGLDAAAIIVALTEHAVDFVVIGGVAVQAHGYVRGTNDLDLVPEPGLRNLSRLGEALAQIGARLARSDRPFDVTNPQLLKRAPLIPLTTRHGRVDLINLDQIPGAPRSYVDLRARATLAHLGDAEVPIAGLDDLVRMKRAAGREEDLRDLAALTRSDEDLERESRERDRSLELDPDELEEPRRE